MCGSRSPGSRGGTTARRAVVPRDPGMSLAWKVAVRSPTIRGNLSAQKRPEHGLTGIANDVVDWARVGRCSVDWVWPSVGPILGGRRCQEALMWLPGPMAQRGRVPLGGGATGCQASRAPHDQGSGAGVGRHNGLAERRRGKRYRSVKAWRPRLPPRTAYSADDEDPRFALSGGAGELERPGCLRVWTPAFAFLVAGDGHRCCVVARARGSWLRLCGLPRASRGSRLPGWVVDAVGPARPRPIAGAEWVLPVRKALVGSGHGGPRLVVRLARRGGPLLDTADRKPLT